MTEDSQELCGECGYELETFACKIRHLQINTGDAKASRDRFGFKEED